MKKKISHEISDIERAYYGSKNVLFDHISIKGPLDGESAFKECQNIEINNSHFYLRYPCWHDTNALLSNITLTKSSRAPFWYDKNISFNNIKCKGVKAVRECQRVKITNSTFDSIEFGWKCRDIDVKNTSIISSYAFLQSRDVSLQDVNFKGKYSFQYVKNLNIDKCVLDTKDAFWHSENATVSNSTIIGEYLGWYSTNLTLINCHIVGTQPLCYCRNLKLINCTFEKADLAFEFSEVNGTINGTLTSIKNPLKGEVFIDQIPEMIIDKSDRSNGMFKLLKK